MNILKSKSAQSTLEYAIIIAVVVAGLLAMQIYMKRGLQGKLRESTDSIGGQFEAQKSTVISTKGNTGTTRQEVGLGVTTTNIVGNQKETESGSEKVDAW